MLDIWCDDIMVELLAPCLTSDYHSAHENSFEERTVMTNEELEARIMMLEDLVFNLARTITFHQEMTSYAMLGAQIKRYIDVYKRKIQGEVIVIPEGTKDLKFYKEVGKKGHKKKVPKGCMYTAIGPDIAGLLLSGGYETLHDLNGATLGQVFGISGFGPSRIRDFMRFIYPYLPQDCKTE